MFLEDPPLDRAPAQQNFLSERLRMCVDSELGQIFLEQG